MASPGAGGGMNSDQLRRVMRDLGDAVNAYQQGQGFGGIEKLASEIEQLRGASYVVTRRRSAMRSSGRITAPSSAS